MACVILREPRHCHPEGALATEGSRPAAEILRCAQNDGGASNTDSSSRKTPFRMTLSLRIAGTCHRSVAGPVGPAVPDDSNVATRGRSRRRGSDEPVCDGRISRRTCRKGNAVKHCWTSFLNRPWRANLGAWRTRCWPRQEGVVQWTQRVRVPRIGQPAR